MIKTCKIKKCLDKGLGLLHEYAGLEDQISALSINGRNELTFLTTFLNDSLVDETILIERFVWLSKNTMQLILKVSDLRKLQRCPRPFISVKEEGDEKSSLVTDIRNDCNALCKLLVRKGIKWSQLRINILHLPILLTPLSEDTRLRIADDLEFVKSPIFLEISRSIREVLEIEDRIEKTWDGIQMMCPNGDTLEAQESFPVLNLPYRKAKPPSSETDWFLEVLEKYTHCTDHLQYILESTKDHLDDDFANTVSANTVTARPLSVLEEPKKEVVNSWSVAVEHTTFDGDVHDNGKFKVKNFPIATADLTSNVDLNNSKSVPDSRAQKLPV